jgi:hypothetical protein
MPNKFRVFVRNKPQAPDFRMPLIGEVDSFTDFECIARFRDVGAWSIELPAGTEQADLFRPGRGIVVFVEGHNDPVFSGPVRTLKHVKNKDESGNGTLTVQGACDNIIIDERVGRGQPYNSFDYELDTPWSGYIQTLSGWRVSKSSPEFVWGLLSNNWGLYYLSGAIFPFADLSRKIHYLDIGPVLPASVEALPADAIWNQYPIRMTNLRDAVFDMAERANFNFRAYWNPTTEKISVDISSVVDKSGTVVFDEQVGNLVGYEITSEAPVATRVVLAGAQPSDGETRRYYEYRKNRLFDPPGWTDYQSGGDPATWGDPYWGRTFIEAEWNVSNEMYIDVRESKWHVALSDDNRADPPPAGSEEFYAFLREREKFFVENSPKGSIKLDVIDIDDCTFGVDYKLGDRVRCLLDTSILPQAMVDADGVLRQEVREVRLASSASEMWVIQPSIGTVDAGSTPYVYRRLRKMRRRIELNETRRTS